MDPELMALVAQLRAMRVQTGALLQQIDATLAMVGAPVNQDVPAPKDTRPAAFNRRKADTQDGRTAVTGATGSEEGPTDGRDLADVLGPALIPSNP